MDAALVFTPANQITLCVWCGDTKPHGTQECLQTLARLVRDLKRALETKSVLAEDRRLHIDILQAKLNAIRREAQ